MGSCLTVIILLTTFMFSYTKIVTIQGKHDVDILSAVIENGIDQEFKFTASEHGFFVSAALTPYD